MFSLLLSLACSDSKELFEESVEQPKENIFQLMAGTGDTAEPLLPEIVVLTIGQSNNCAINSKPSNFPYSLQTNQSEVVSIRNGILKSSYGGVVPPDPYIIDELIQVGYLPEQITIVARCAQNTRLVYSIEQLIPAIEQDLINFGITTPPSFGMLWQGETDAKNEDGVLYSDTLLGTEGGISFYDEFFVRWPEAQLAIVELAVTSTDYAPKREIGLVSAAHRLSRAFDQTCSVSTAGATFLPGTNLPGDNPHVDLASLEEISRRVVQTWVNMDSCL